MTPAGGAFGAASVVDADGTVAPHVVIEPDGATVPAGETDVRDVPGDGTGEPTGGADPATGQPSAGPATDPAVKPSIATKTTTTTAVTKTTVAKASNPKTATATSSSLPKTADGYWIAMSAFLFVLGTAILEVARRC